MNKNNQIDIIVVDDNANNLKFLSQMLQESGYLVRSARSGKLALAAAAMSAPDIFLLDIGMPEMDGYEVCRRIKADEKLLDIPVIFISASNETFDKVKAFSVGGVDYVSKPFQYEEVLARIRTHIELDRQRREIERLRQQERSYYESLSEMKDHVVQTATHDLKNPLTGIRMHAELLQIHLKEDAKAQSHLEMIDYSIEHMLEIISTMLDLAKLETGFDMNLEPVSLVDFLDTLHSMFHAQAESKEIALSFGDIAADLTVSVDRLQFSRVLENLLSNAIKYTPEGGTVSLAVTAEDGANELCIAVQDTGMGIPEEDISEIFNKFYRVNTVEHMEQVGSGLGLSIVKTIIEQHGGRIVVESVLGAGSIFSVWLPWG